jgi:hypothetical protein
MHVSRQNLGRFAASAGFVNGSKELAFPAVHRFSQWRVPAEAVPEAVLLG